MSEQETARRSAAGAGRPMVSLTDLGKHKDAAASVGRLPAAASPGGRAALPSPGCRRRHRHRPSTRATCVDDAVHPAGHHDGRPPGAVLRRPGARQEHAVGADAGDGHLLAGRRAVGSSTATAWRSPRATPSSAASIATFLNGVTTSPGTFAPPPSARRVIPRSSSRRSRRPSRASPAPDRRRLRRAHQVLGGADVHGAVVHLQLRRSRTWSGSGRVGRLWRPTWSMRMNAKAGRSSGSRGARSTSPAAPSAHQRRGAGSGRRLRDRQAHRLRPRSLHAPHSLTLTMVGASLLWVGWFGFNAGSPRSQQLAALAFINTSSRPLPRSCRGASARPDEGQGLDAGRRLRCGRRSGRDHPGRRQRRHRRCADHRPDRRLRLPVGVHGLKRMLGADDSLDVFGVHGVGGILGALLTGVFNSPNLGGPGIVADWVTVGMVARTPTRSPRRSGSRPRACGSPSCGRRWSR